MRKLLVLLLALASFGCVRAQVIGFALSPAGAEDTPACPATVYPAKPRTAVLGTTGSVASGGVVYFCVFPVKSGGVVVSGTLHIDYVTGFVNYVGDQGTKVALKMYVDGAIIPVIAERVSAGGQYAVAQPMN